MADRLSTDPRKPWMKGCRIYSVAVALGVCCFIGTPAASAVAAFRCDMEPRSAGDAPVRTEAAAAEEAALEECRDILDHIDSMLAKPDLPRESRIRLHSGRVPYSSTLGRWNESFDSSMELARLYEDQPEQRLRWLREAVTVKAMEASESSDEDAFALSLRVLRSMQGAHRIAHYATPDARSEGAFAIARAAHGVHSIYATSNVRAPALAQTRKELLVEAREVYEQDVSQQTRDRVATTFSKARFNLAVGLAQAEAGDTAGAAISIADAINDAADPGQLLFTYLWQGPLLAIEDWAGVNLAVSVRVEEETARFVVSAEALSAQTLDERGRDWLISADATLSSFDTLASAGEANALGWMAQRVRSRLRSEIASTESLPPGRSVIVSPSGTIPLP